VKDSFVDDSLVETEDQSHFEERSFGVEELIKVGETTESQS
jgi:hypothetical protein